MSIRHLVKSVAVSGAAAICGVALVIGLSGAAGATQTSSLPSSDGNTTLTTNIPITPGTPYSSGQTVALNVVAGPLSSANLTAAGVPTSGVFYIEECTDVNGDPANLPTSPSTCEGDNLITVPKTSNGGFSENLTVYDLPDALTLGGTTLTGNSSCDVAPNQCVFAVLSLPFADGAAAFKAPHLFSAPFQVQIGPDGIDDGASPGDGTPEVSLAIALPLLALAGFGVWTIRRRRHLASQDSTTS
jgi:hypothetical protein